MRFYIIKNGLLVWFDWLNALKLDMGCMGSGGGVGDNMACWLKDMGGKLGCPIEGGNSGCASCPKVAPPACPKLIEAGNEGNMDCCCCCCCWLCNWPMVGFFWFMRSCWATNGLFNWPLELLVLIAPVIGCWLLENTAWLPPNGFVLLGRAGIRFSRFTSDEFSPKKLSGVLRCAAACANGTLLFLLSPGLSMPNEDSALGCSFEFHGFVEFLLTLLLVLAPVVVEVPKKSPNGSELLLVGAAAVTGDWLVARTVVNKSKSSILLGAGLLACKAAGEELRAHGSALGAAVFDCQGFVASCCLACWKPVAGELENSLPSTAHGSTGGAGFALPAGFSEASGGKKSSLSVSSCWFMLNPLLLFLLGLLSDHGSLKPLSPRSTSFKMKFKILNKYILIK